MLAELDASRQFQEHFAQSFSSSGNLVGWLDSQRLLHHQDVVTKVTGKNAIVDDLSLLSEENVEEISCAMTHVEKMRFQAALEALRKGQATELAAAGTE